MKVYFCVMMLLIAMLNCTTDCVETVRICHENSCIDVELKWTSQSSCNFESLGSSGFKVKHVKQIIASCASLPCEFRFTHNLNATKDEQ